MVSPGSDVITACCPRRPPRPPPAPQRFTVRARDGGTYFFRNVVADYFTAEGACLDAGGELAGFNTQASRDAVNTICSGFRACWIGGPSRDGKCPVRNELGQIGYTDCNQGELDAVCVR